MYQVVYRKYSSRDTVLSYEYSLLMLPIAAGIYCISDYVCTHRFEHVVMCTQLCTHQVPKAVAGTQYQSTSTEL